MLVLQQLQAGIYAPSGMNKQSCQFTVVQNKEKIELLPKVHERKDGIIKFVK